MHWYLLLMLQMKIQRLEKVLFLSFKRVEDDERFFVVYLKNDLLVLFHCFPQKIDFTVLFLENGFQVRDGRVGRRGGLVHVGRPVGGRGTHLKL